MKYPKTIAPTSERHYQKSKQFLENQIQQELENFKTDTMLKMQIIGRIGKGCTDTTVNGKNVTNFTVAHSEKYKDSKGNNQGKTTWVDCAYWTDRTAVAPYLTKGTQVYVEGTPEVRPYNNTQGETEATLSLRVREVQLLGGRSETAPQAAGVEDSDSDLPF